MSYTIRELEPIDYDDVLSLWSDAGLPYKPYGRDSREKLTQEMQRDDTGFFGLFDGKRMLAVGFASYDGRRGWINRLAVHPDHRGRGLAAQIIAVCERFLQERGAVVYSALIEDVNSPSMSCFEKAGYICLNEFKYFRKADSEEA